MAHFALIPGVGAAFRDALFGLASISFDPLVSELRLSRKRLAICCRDTAGENVGNFSMYLDDCSTGSIFSWDENRVLIVSPLNLLSHLRRSMLDLQANHRLIVSIRLHENENEEPLVLLDTPHPVSIFRFFFPISRRVAEMEDSKFCVCPSPSVCIPAKVCVQAAIRLGGEASYLMVVSENGRRCTFSPQGEYLTELTLTRSEHDVDLNTKEEVVDYERNVTISGWLSLLFGCRYPKHMLSTAYIPLDQSLPNCISYDIFYVIL